MKILFWGSTRYNSGPDNVNKELIRNLTDSFYCPDSENKILPSLSEIIKLLKSDVLVVSGLSPRGYAMEFLAKLLGKKLVFILHGYFAEEAKVNNLTKAHRGIWHEQVLLKAADLILPVSRKYMLWMQKQCPEYAGKMNYLYNGLNKEELLKIVSRQKVKGTIAAVGGDREIKNNVKITQLVETMAGVFQLSIFGALYHGKPSEQYKHCTYMGIVDHDKYLEQLSRTEIFVLNSVLESFSISVIEALFCGCSVLISEVAGVTDLLELEESDLIYDPMDLEEIKRKLLYLQIHPNNRRIMSKLNVDNWTYDKAVERLEQLCKNLKKQNSRDNRLI